MDPRDIKLAKQLVNYSVKLQKGEKVLIDARGSEIVPLVQQIVKEVYAVGAIPFVQYTDDKISRELLLGTTQEQLDITAKIESDMMHHMDAYIGAVAVQNSMENSDVPMDKIELHSKAHRKPVTTIRLTKKWVILRYPTAGFAQSAKKSLEAFKDEFFNVCNLDYKKMDDAMEPLKLLMERTDKVKIIGKGTDLTFSIKDIPAVKCAGTCNIPDGEVFTAPVKNSVNGKLSYNTPSEYQGFTYENVVLEFKDGKIINATANDTDRINKIFDADEGARFIGEFSIAVNPYILTPMNNILFDEKIMGSFHFTPGNAYTEAFNGNLSSVHWDLVCIQTPEFGGGEIYFDDILIRKDGKFVIEELYGLNPENLK
jgi:aminopeptidase